MPQARYRLVDTETTPYYHCMSRCVKRAFLCGQDRFTGKNFDHRKQWILGRVKLLSSVFSIDVCAFAIMSNHFHLVLHVDTQRAQQWSDEEVIVRWSGLYKGPELLTKYNAGESLSSFEEEALIALVGVWRTRLGSLSWYMRCLNEAIARMANEEDNCTGRFWEGRFKSQALLNEAALISCMAYVDLNPIRAGLSEALENSEFTSIQERIYIYKQNENDTYQNWLMPLVKQKEIASTNSLLIQETDYFALVDWTGRAIRDDSKGAIPGHIQPILQHLGVNEANWVTSTQYFGSRFYRALGRINQIRKLAIKTDQQWIKGLLMARQFYQ